MLELIMSCFLGGIVVGLMIAQAVLEHIENKITNEKEKEIIGKA